MAGAADERMGLSNHAWLSAVSNAEGIEVADLLGLASKLPVEGLAP